MKKIVSIFCVVVIAFLTVPFAAFSQGSPISGLLSKYYNIKNALVANDAANAAKEAADFTALAKGVNITALAAGEQQVFKSIQDKLVADASTIAGSKDLTKQRTSFQTLSANIITLSKATKVNNPVYVAYCPMKRAYWLSAEQGIKNPYYGTAMLTCGSVTETIKP
jgi:hypothetical protein